ncbi:MAG: hypothetical protein H0W23_10490 [Chloroflexia bacterium]|nr:hypothetical protein [Chloroflexia bacterium]
MSDPQANGTGSSDPRSGQPARDTFDDVDPGLVKPADLGSASRSCLAIIVVLVVILLLLCVFLIGQQVS